MKSNQEPSVPGPVGDSGSPVGVPGSPVGDSGSPVGDSVGDIGAAAGADGAAAGGTLNFAALPNIEEVREFVLGLPIMTRGELGKILATTSLEKGIAFLVDLAKSWKDWSPKTQNRRPILNWIPPAILVLMLPEIMKDVPSILGTPDEIVTLDPEEVLKWYYMLQLSYNLNQDSGCFCRLFFGLLSRCICGGGAQHMSGRGDDDVIDPAWGHMGIERKDQYEQKYRMKAMARFVALRLVRWTRCLLLQEHVCAATPVRDLSAKDLPEEWRELVNVDCAAVRERSVADHYCKVSERLVIIMQNAGNEMLGALGQLVGPYEDKRRHACNVTCSAACSSAACSLAACKRDLVTLHGREVNLFKIGAKYVDELWSQRRKYTSHDYRFNYTVSTATLLHGLQCSDAKFRTEVADTLLNPKLRHVNRLQALPRENRKPKFIESAVSHASRVAAAEKELKEKQGNLLYAKAGLPLVEDMHQEFVCAALCGAKCVQSCVDESGFPLLNAHEINQVIIDAILKEPTKVHEGPRDRAKEKEAQDAMLNRVKERLAPLLLPLLRKVQRAEKCLAACRMLAEKDKGTEQEIEERRQRICAEMCHKYCSPGCTEPCLSCCDYSLAKDREAIDTETLQYLFSDAFADEASLHDNPLQPYKNPDQARAFALNSYAQVLCPGTLTALAARMERAALAALAPAAQATHTELAAQKDGAPPVGIIPINSVPNVGTAAAAGGMLAMPALPALPAMPALPTMSAPPSLRFKRLSQALAMGFGEHPESVASRLALLAYCENVENGAEQHARQTDLDMQAMLSRSVVSAQLDAELVREIQAAMVITGPHSPLLGPFVTRLIALHKFVCNLNATRWMG